MISRSFECDKSGDVECHSFSAFVCDSFVRDLVTAKRFLLFLCCGSNKTRIRELKMNYWSLFVHRNNVDGWRRQSRKVLSLMNGVKCSFFKTRHALLWNFPPSLLSK